MIGGGVWRSGPARGVARALVLLLTAALAQEAIAHPDLLTQIEAISERLLLDPSDTDLLMQRGDLYRRHQEYVLAARDLAAARTAEPDNPLLDLYEGRLTLEMGIPERAAALLQSCLHWKPEHALAWRLLGLAHKDMRHWQAAAASFGRAIEFSAAPGPELFRLQALSLLAANAPASETYRVIDRALAHFGLEVTVLGLGIDVALAAGDLGRTGAYLTRVPAGLLRLPQWLARSEAFACMQSAGPAQRASCVADARSRLDESVAGFARASD